MGEVLFWVVGDGMGVGVGEVLFWVVGDGRGVGVGEVLFWVVGDGRGVGVGVGEVDLGVCFLVKATPKVRAP